MCPVLFRDGKVVDVVHGFETVEGKGLSQKFFFVEHRSLGGGGVGPNRKSTDTVSKICIVQHSKLHHFGVEGQSTK